MTEIPPYDHDLMLRIHGKLLRVLRQYRVHEAGIALAEAAVDLVIEHAPTLPQAREGLDALFHGAKGALDRDIARIELIQRPAAGSA